MDPNATLEEMRKIVYVIYQREVKAAPGSLALASRLAELVGAMDGWLSSGGFLPLDWRHDE